MWTFGDECCAAVVRGPVYDACAGDCGGRRRNRRRNQSSRTKPAAAVIPRAAGCFSPISHGFILPSQAITASAQVADVVDLGAADTRDIKVSPLARRLAQELGVNLASVRGTGTRIRAVVPVAGTDDRIAHQRARRSVHGGAVR